jgi:pimeloyl-ACP methyl ester carboxylesterase
MNKLYPYRLLYCLVCTLTIGSIAPNLAHAQAKIGVVVLHGKQGTPMQSFVAALEAAGFPASSPELPWSNRRIYDRTYDQALEEVDAAVEELKKRGAANVVIVGQSMGAGAALRFAATRAGLAGVVVMAPGHRVDVPAFGNRFAEDVARARRMISAGRADDLETFQDFNADAFNVKASARIYLSMFDPEGAAAFSKNAVLLKPGTPLLWIVGRRDFGFSAGEGYAFARAPSHPASRYVVVDAGHTDTPRNALPIVIDWLNALGR